MDRRGRSRARGRGREQREEAAIPVPPHPVVSHRWLQIPGTLDRRRQAEYIGRMTRLLRQEPDVPHFFDVQMLQTSRILTLLRRMLTQTYQLQDDDEVFTDRGWCALLELHEPVYRELVVEFLSTVHFNELTTNYTDRRQFSFRLGGVSRECSLQDLGWRLGLYTLPETQSPAYIEFMEASIRYPSPDFIPSAFWATIGQGDLDIPRLIERKIRDPLLRFAHRLVATTVSHRHGSEKVSLVDLFYLWTILTSGVHCCLPYEIALFLSQKAAGKLPRSPMCGGHFITRLARSYGLLTPEEEPRLRRIDPMAYTQIALETMQMIERLPGDVIVLPRVAPADPAMPATATTEAGPSGTRPGSSAERPRQRRRIGPSSSTAAPDLHTVAADVATLVAQVGWITSTLQEFYISQHFTPSAPAPFPSRGTHDDEAGPSGIRHDSEEETASDDEDSDSE